MLWKRFIKIEELGRRYYRKGSVKSFKQIPGPLRLPFIGNLWAYSTGKNYGIVKIDEIINYIEPS